MVKSFMIKNGSFAGVMLLVLLASCKVSIKPNALYGKWKYLKIENTDIRSTHIVTPEELEAESPYIQFSKNDSFLISWGSRVLSHGTYQLDGDKIRVKEILEGGKTREFPFVVSKLDDKNLIFETTGDDGAKVTAVKTQ
ncbi:MAG: hypothetical protein ACXVB0_15630 [Mucilaginibacter sp.]